MIVKLSALILWSCIYLRMCLFNSYLVYPILILAVAMPIDMCIPLYPRVFMLMHISNAVALLLLLLGREFKGLLALGLGLGLLGIYSEWHLLYTLLNESNIPINSGYSCLNLIIVILNILILNEDLSIFRLAKPLYASQLSLVILISVFQIYNYSNAFIIKTINPALLSPWINIHVPANIISYSLMCYGSMASIISIIYQEYNQEILELIKNHVIPATSLFILATISGSIWASEAWGSYWQWDPKETWSLILLLNYTTWIHFYISRKVNNKILITWSAFSVCIVFFTFIGVNYSLASMHGYSN